MALIGPLAGEFQRRQRRVVQRLILTHKIGELEPSSSEIVEDVGVTDELLHSPRTPGARPSTAILRNSTIHGTGGWSPTTQGQRPARPTPPHSRLYSDGGRAPAVLRRSVSSEPRACPTS